MKYLIVLSALLLAGCAMTPEEFEQRRIVACNSAKNALAVAETPKARLILEGYLARRCADLYPAEPADV